MEAISKYTRKWSQASISLSKRGLYYCVAMDHKKQSLAENKQFEKDTILNTVEEDKGRYSKQQVLRANLAWKIQKTIRNPSLRKFLVIVESNLFPNCPIVKQDILAAEVMFSPELG